MEMAKRGYYIKKNYMVIKIKIPYAASYIEMFVYNIPPWLLGTLIIVIATISMFKTHLFHL